MPQDKLLTDIKFLKGVGPVKAKLLNEDIGVYNFRDLLYHFPYKYIDRSVVQRVCDLQEGMPHVLLKGQIVGMGHEGAGRGERLIATFYDGSGYMELVWFKGFKHIEKTLKCNADYFVLGKPTSFNRNIQISHPEIQKADEGQEANLCMRPFYNTSERMKKHGLSSTNVATLIENVFDVLGEQKISETLPDYLLKRHFLLPLDDAIRTIHHPPSAKELPEAVRRLKFEELFFLQLDILRYGRNRKVATQGYVFKRVGALFMQFFNERLPFQLTGAQKRVVKEIRRDVGSGKQMNRLVQGDVGSGKTMVALLSCLLALDNGFQACIMAPTEILAEQHNANIRAMLGDVPVKVALLTGNVKGKQRETVLQGVANGTIQLLIGTHALIEPTVRFHNLGFVVIDEQHRFGVKQRAALWKKNDFPPHILVMTATPIPRTLAMTVYGDLDVSIIDEMPPGRKPIQTIHYTEHDRPKLYAGMLKQLQKGSQIYVVFPRIEENGKEELKDLLSGYSHLVDLFPDYIVGMVHGQMKPEFKDSAMQAFKSGQIQILVSTTVIEVGVDVPNASVIVVENAERFGLAQLHQLRGRVGRGSRQSFCILMTNSNLTENSRRRMDILVESNDGFEIAEEDMRLRGPGDVEGTAQSGMPFDLKIAHIIKDQSLMALAREEAAKVLESDPDENLPAHQSMWRNLALLKNQIINFSAIS